jgi:hypothetical protein
MEVELQRAYWFQDDHKPIEGISEVHASCKKVWYKLESSLKRSKEGTLFLESKKYQACRYRLCELKRNRQPTLHLPPLDHDVGKLMEKLESFCSTQKWHMQCDELVQQIVISMKRVIAMCEAMELHADKKVMPLFYSVCSAEIQVNIISLSLHLLLSTIDAADGRPHHLFLDGHGLEVGRPLMHVHRVDLLWNFFKEHCSKVIDADILAFVDTFLPLFIGDPRYLHPNKTSLTNDIIRMREKVLLLKKVIDDGFFADEDLKLLNRHIGKEWKHFSKDAKMQYLTSGIKDEIKEHKRKSSLALHLASILLELSV